VTVRRLLAIAVIFLGCTLSWLALGSSLVVRTGEFDAQLGQEVALLWGGPHVQVAPEAAIARPREASETVVEKNPTGKDVVREVRRTVLDWAAVPILQTRADVDLDLEQRQKGLLWYDTYVVKLHATYAVENPDDVPRTLRIKVPFPSTSAIYDEFLFTVDGRRASPTGDLSKEVETETEVPARGRATVALGYRSRGLGDWKYAFSRSGVVDVKDFVLNLKTNVKAIDYPAGTMSPTERIEEGEGWRILWRFSDLVTGQAIGVDLPNRLNPGPLAARITFFAPVALLFFLTVMVMLDVLSSATLHPMHYFFISAAFFAFHLLLAYLVDRISIHASFLAAALVSLALVGSYLRAVAGAERRLWPALAAQAVYLVAFSYAFFFEGSTGLAVTIGAIVTLFVLMQATAHVTWGEVFGGVSRAAR
jgi:inner membrane protein involved in colicin E2 resistance